MDINKILASKLINKAELSRLLELSSPAILNQKIKNTAGNKLTEKNLADIKVVFENAVKEAEIIGLQNLINVIRLLLDESGNLDREAKKTIISDYQNHYSDIGLMEWFEESKSQAQG